MVPLYLVRHGQDIDNAAGVLNGHRDEPLTTKGRREARDCARRLKSARIDIVVSSPLKRALETAQIVAGAWSYSETIVIDAQLIERDFGTLTGTLEADIEKNSRDVRCVGGTTYFLSGPGIEGFPSVFGRAQRFLDRVNEEWSGQTVLVVTHGDTGKMIRAARLGMRWEKGLEFSLPNAAAIRL